MEIEDDGLVGGKQRVKVAIAQPVGVLPCRHQSKQVNHVHKPHLQVGKLFSQNGGRRQRFFGDNVAAAGHHHVGNIGLGAAVVVAGPVPNTDALGAVGYRLRHVEVLEVVLLVGDNHIDVVHAAEAVVGHREQAVGVGRKVNPHHVGAFISD